MAAEADCVVLVTDHAQIRLSGHPGEGQADRGYAQCVQEPPVGENREAVNSRLPLACLLTSRENAWRELVADDKVSTCLS